MESTFWKFHVTAIASCVVCLCLGSRVSIASPQDAETLFGEKLSEIVLAPDEVGAYVVRVQQASANFKDTERDKAVLKESISFLAVDAKRERIRYDSGVVEDTGIWSGNSRFLSIRRGEPKEWKTWHIGSVGSSPVKELSHDELANVRFRPRCPFMIPIAGAKESGSDASWWNAFAGPITILRPDQLSHERIVGDSVVGWVKGKAITSLMFTFNKSDGIKDVAIETYPVHNKLNYENPSATTGWYTKSKSKWERKEHALVPVFAEVRSQQGIPGDMDCHESTSTIEWRFLKKEDEWVFSSENLDSLDRSLESFFRK